MSMLFCGVRPGKECKFAQSVKTQPHPGKRSTSEPKPEAAAIEVSPLWTRTRAVLWELIEWRWNVDEAETKKEVEVFVHGQKCA